MLVFICKFTVEGGIETTNDEVPIVLILHEFLYTAELPKADALTIEDALDDVLQELLVLTKNKGFRL